MSQSAVHFVNTTLVPAGLICIMFSLGLTLTLTDFSRLFSQPRPVMAGLFGHFICLPLLGIAIAALFRLPPDLALGLFILSVCPAGATSNAVTFAARGNVALAVTLTTLTSLITIVTTPLLIKWALTYYVIAGEAPTISVPGTMRQLLIMTGLPVLTGMAVRRMAAGAAVRLETWLRPVALVILIAVIVAAIVVSAKLLLNSIVHAGPAAWALNTAAMACGLGLGWVTGVSRADRMTLGLEVGIQNATMATFLSLTVLNNWAVAITPTLYGCIMLLNAGLMVRLVKRAWRRHDSALVQSQSGA